MKCGYLELGPLPHASDYVDSGVTRVVIQGLSPHFLHQNLDDGNTWGQLSLSFNFTHVNKNPLLIHNLFDPLVLLLPFHFTCVLSSWLCSY